MLVNIITVLVTRRQVLIDHNFNIIDDMEHKIR